MLVRRNTSESTVIDYRETAPSGIKIEDYMADPELLIQGMIYHIWLRLLNHFRWTIRGSPITNPRPSHGSCKVWSDVMVRHLLSLHSPRPSRLRHHPKARQYDKRILAMSTHASNLYILHVEMYWAD